MIQTFPFLRLRIGTATGRPTWKGQPGTSVQHSHAIIRSSQVAFHAELDWALHLGLSAVLLPMLRHPSEYALYSQAINSHLKIATSQLHMWLQIPLVPRKLKEKVSGDQVGIKNRLEETSWEMWNRIRCLCGHSARLHACLVLTKELPERSELGRWMGESVKGMIVPTSVFLQNKKGFPVLPVKHQEFIVSMFDYNVQFIIRPSDPALSSHIACALHAVFVALRD